MKNIHILIVSDNKEGTQIARELKELEIFVSTLKLNKIYLLDMSKAKIVILIINLDNISLDKILAELEKQKIPGNWLKFIFLKNKFLKDIRYENFNIFHLEFLQRPVRIAEFLLLMEKTILTEKFKLMLREVSVELKEKSESMENLYNVMRKKLFNDNSSSIEVFSKIIKMQKRLDDETLKMQNSIKKFSSFRQKNLYFEDTDQSESIFESLIPAKPQKNQEISENIKNLQETNIGLEKDLIAAGNRILELEKELGIKAIKQIKSRL